MLATRLGRSRATRIAAHLGHLFALLFVTFCLVSGNPFVLLIGIFVYFGASAEAAHSELWDLGHKLFVSEAMRSNVQSIQSGAPLIDAIGLMIETGEHAIPVFRRDGQFLGVATKDAIIRAVHRDGQDASIDHAVESNVPSIGTHQKLSDALDLMQRHSAPAVLVLAPDGRMAGVVTPETLTDAMMMQDPALTRHQPAPPHPARTPRREEVTVPSSV
jgi:CBS domain-containing protein